MTRVLRCLIADLLSRWNTHVLHFDMKAAMTLSRSSKKLFDSIILKKGPCATFLRIVGRNTTGKNYSYFIDFSQMYRLSSRRTITVYLHSKPTTKSVPS